MTEVTFGTLLGSGGYKTAFNVIRKPSDDINNYTLNNYTFTTDIEPSKLVMVITKIHLSSGETVLNNKQLKNLITELTYQYNLSINDPKLAPFIYKIKVIKETYSFLTGKQEDSLNEINITDFLTNPNTYLNNSIITSINKDDKIRVVVLEEKCGIPIINNNNVVINEHFIKILITLVFLITTLTESFFKDFKIDNTCPVYDSSGNLINLIGLDFDSFFIEKFNDIASTFEQNTNLHIRNTTIQSICQNIMIVQFLVNLLLKYTKKVAKNQENLLNTSLTLSNENKRKIEYEIQVINSQITAIKSKLQQISKEKLLKMVSFLSYISPYTTTNLLITYKDICKQNLFIHYILTPTNLYNNSQSYSYEGYIMLLKELYVELVKIIYDETITEADVDFYPANEFSRVAEPVAEPVAQAQALTEPVAEQPSVENNNIYLKIQIINDLLDKYLESLSCNVVKVLQQEGEQNPFISNTIQSQIRKGIIENNKKVNLNENNVTELIKILVNYLYTNKISYIDQDGRCNYYINTNIINSEELEILGYYITTLTNTTSGGKVNKRKKLTKRKVKRKKLTKRKKKI